MLDPEKHERIGTVDLVRFRGKYLRDDWREMTKLPFEDAWFDAPVKYDRVLRAMYGEYMTLPPEKKRKAHLRDDMIIDTKRSYQEHVLHEPGSI